MRKLTIEKATELLEEYVTKDELAQEQEKKEWDEIDKKYPLDYKSNYAFGESPREKAFDEHEKKWHSNDFDKNRPYLSKIMDLTTYNIPIKKCKRCCDNCGALMCKIRRIVPDHTRYCSAWRSPPREELFLESSYIMIEEAYKLAKLSLADRIKKQVQDYVEDYKEILEKAVEYESRVDGTTLPIPEQFVKRCRQIEKDNRKLRNQYRKEYNKCWELKGKKTDILRYRELNPDKAAKLNEKYGMCLMTVSMDMLGFGKLPFEKAKSWEDLEGGKF